MNRIIAILVLSLFSFTVAFSFHPHSKNCDRNKKKCKEHRITPEKAEQLNKLKNEFDQQLEPKDLELLNDLRDKTYIQKDKMKSQIMEIKNSTDDKNERKTKIKELFESEKEEKVKIKTELDNLLNKYPDEVAELKLKLKELIANNKKHKKQNESKYRDKSNSHFYRFILSKEISAKQKYFNNLIDNSNNINVEVIDNNLKFNIENANSNSIVKIYDIMGNEIAVKENVAIIDGINEVAITTITNNLANGKYILVIQNETGISTGKFLYLK